MQQSRSVIGIPSWRTVLLAAVVAAALPVAEALATFDVAILANPEPWLTGLAVGALRAFAGSLLYAVWGPRA